MKKILTVDSGIKDPYTKRILANILDRDPMEVLRESPKALKRLVRVMSDKQLRQKSGIGNWTVTQIVSHLCDAELVVNYRIRLALAESGSKIQAYDESMWAKQLHYETSDPRAKVALFTALREGLVALLESVPAKDLQKFGLHEERGKETVERMVQMLAGHDINHINRIAEIRKKLFAGTAG